jgi:hypothetical protein
VNNKLTLIRLLYALILLTLILSACSPASSTPQVIKETVVVIVTSTAPAETTTPVSVATNTPVPPTDLIPTVTLTPLPSPTPLLLLNVAIEGGDQNHKFYVLLVYPNYKVVGTSQLWFRVYAHNPTKSKVDGEGIDSVQFTFVNSDGDTVYDHKETSAAYCAFGGPNTDCTPWVPAEHNNAWPNGTTITPGTYTLLITASTKPDGNGDVFTMDGKTKFTIN